MRNESKYAFYRTDTVNEGHCIQIELIVDPEYKRFQNDVGKMVSHPELSEIRFIVGDQIVFQAEREVARKLCTDLVSMIEESGIGRQQ